VESHAPECEPEFRGHRVFRRILAALLGVFGAGVGLLLIALLLAVV
jgi:hypothetical protein